ncbi:hypothetical protein [Streptomyces sp. SID12501]|uniref:Type VII secretion protein EccC n=1 Tax=Streptomyces sp. SID12501 TaxID=2706042 RepID=A0A6B3C2Q3_9ACTN|nr:hypothetical protein [Streptomyces sp. SID12501]NEC91071.1 hypothetical protein [Streptomyces sp. SID12501]
MSTVIVKRAPRVHGPQEPSEQIELAEPPVLAEPATADFSSVLVFLPMALGTVAMIMMFSLRDGSPTTCLMSGMMGISMVGMNLGQLGGSSSDRKRQMQAERRDYLRYLAQLRRRAWTTADAQRTAALWDSPPPGRLWSVAGGLRVWERLPGHDGFARIRIGLVRGPRASALKFPPRETKPIDGLEPLPVGLRRLSSVEVTGDPHRRTVPARPARGSRPSPAAAASGTCQDHASADQRANGERRPQVPHRHRGKGRVGAEAPVRPGGPVADRLRTATIKVGISPFSPALSGAPNQYHSHTTE